MNPVRNLLINSLAIYDKSMIEFKSKPNIQQQISNGVNKNNQKGFTLTPYLGRGSDGFVVFFITILVLIAVFGIALSISLLTLGQQKIINNIIKATQSYYIAEAGIEDALLRLNNNPNMAALSYTFNIGSGTASIDILDMLAGSRTIISQGDSSNRTKKLRVVRAITTDGVSFFYGSQAGDGGIEMENNSVIYGNVFSNGNVIGSGTITETVIVAGNGNKIQGTVIDLIIGGDAYVHTCEDSNISGTLTYVSGGSFGSCTAGQFVDGGPNEIEPIDLPISQNQIDNWKSDIADAGVQFSSHIVLSGTTEHLGPLKIEGDLTVEIGATLILNGNLWVTGNILIENGGIISLDNGYSSTSGVIIANGKITAENGSILEGSGVEGSYIMLLSTDESFGDADNPAVYVKNTAEGAIFYASKGTIRLLNVADIREAVGWKIYLNNNAEITYETGLANLLFSSGPSGGWKVIEWKEIE